MWLRKLLYQVLTVVWLVALVGAVISLDQGLAAPWLSMADVPGGMVGAVAAAIGLFAVGMVVISARITRLERAAWRTAGQAAGLEPAAGDGNGEDTQLTGTVDGRPVTASYEKQKVGGGNQSTGHVWLTRGTADLAGPADHGVVVGPVDGRVDAGIGTIDFDQMAETVADSETLVGTEAGGLYVAGTSAAAVDAVATDASGDMLRTGPDLNIAAVGDATGVVAEWARTHNEAMEGVGSSLAEYPVDNLLERVPGDAGTVTVETRSQDQLHESDDLRHLVAGAVAVADAFEAATTPESASE